MKTKLCFYWFTYGIYALLNNPDVLKNNGILTDGIIKNTLLEVYIAKDGKPYNKKEDAGKDFETISYTNKDRPLFKEILVNYKFAMHYHKRHHDILLPLATPLYEPKTLNFNKEDMTNKYLEIRFKILPKDLFFKLAILTETHLNHPDDLWRTGVILNYFIDGTKALIKVENSTLSIHTKGQYKVKFLQLLSHYIQAILLETKLSYNSFERVLIKEKTDKKEAEYDLIDSKL